MSFMNGSEPRIFMLNRLGAKKCHAQRIGAKTCHAALDASLVRSQELYCTIGSESRKFVQDWLGA